MWPWCRLGCHFPESMAPPALTARVPRRGAVAEHLALGTPVRRRSPPCVPNVPGSRRRIRSRAGGNGSGAARLEVLLHQNRRAYGEGAWIGRLATLEVEGPPARSCGHPGRSISGPGQWRCQTTFNAAAIEAFVRRCRRPQWTKARQRKNDGLGERLCKCMRDRAEPPTADLQRRGLK